MLILEEIHHPGAEPGIIKVLEKSRAGGLVELTTLLSSLPSIGLYSMHLFNQHAMPNLKFVLHNSCNTC